MQGGYWLLSLNRKMSTEEMERLQGIPALRLKIPPTATERRYKGMLGNAFTVSVVGRVALRLLHTVGIGGAGVSDPWVGGRAPQAS